MQCSLAAVRTFLHRKDIEFSVQRYGVDALGSMALGLFASLIIGLIFKTAGTKLGVGMFVEVGKLAMDMSGPCIGVAVAWGLKAPVLVLFASAVTGMAGYAAGGPAGAFAAAAVGAEGGKIIAEGGGMVLLSRSLTVREGGSTYEMSGVLPFGCTMIDSHLHTGYRIIEASEISLRGHEFRFLSIDTDNGKLASGVKVCSVKNTRGTESETCIYRYKNVIAGFTHWYWGETDILRLWDYV